MTLGYVVMDDNYPRNVLRVFSDPLKAAAYVTATYGPGFGGTIQTRVLGDHAPIDGHDKLGEG